MRPSVAGPTGTVIGLPVSVASMPRRKPSVLVIATARTQSLPRCCCTSSTIRSLPMLPVASVPSVFTSTALYISGNWSGGNSMSTTGPVICTIFPVAGISLLLLLTAYLDDGRRATDDRYFHRQDAKVRQD